MPGSVEAAMSERKLLPVARPARPGNGERSYGHVQFLQCPSLSASYEQLHVGHVLGYESEPFPIRVEAAEEPPTPFGGIHPGGAANLSVLLWPQGFRADYRIPDGGHGNVGHNSDDTQRAAYGEDAKGSSRKFPH